MKCKKCGRCCDLVTLKVKITPALIPDSAPKGWLQKHWHFVKKKGKSYGYSCDFYDRKTHLCRIHKTKPAVCRNFPYQKEHPDDYQKFTPKGCGYKCL